MKVNVLPENIAEAVLHFASEARSSGARATSSTSTAEVKARYPRYMRTDVVRIG